MMPTKDLAAVLHLEPATIDNARTGKARLSLRHRGALRALVAGGRITQGEIDLMCPLRLPPSAVRVARMMREEGAWPAELEHLLED